MVFDHSFQNIISLENLCKAWDEFVCGKKTKKDVCEFSLRLSQNIYDLHNDLQNKNYQHGSYEAFSINDPKPRSIHKATVRDRLLHHAIYRVLYLYFDNEFIYDSYSCRDLKGTHKALNRFNQFIRKVSQNNTRTCWVLKCDIRMFFANINHAILLEIITRYIPDRDTVSLLSGIIESFHSTTLGVGLPLGNLASQLFVNIYMNEFDQYMKHRINAKYYIRYADDFVILSESKTYLENILPSMKAFLWERLKLTMHPDKVFIKTIAQGIDFLGWIHFPRHRVLRTSTKKRMFKNIEAKKGKKETVDSYLGLLKHGNGWKLEERVMQSL